MDFRESLEYQISSTSVQWQPSSMRADGRTDGRTDMTKLIVTFRNFAKAPKNAQNASVFVYPYIFQTLSSISGEILRFRRLNVLQQIHTCSKIHYRFYAS
jgi:hypothetical protein